MRGLATITVVALLAMAACSDDDSGSSLDLEGAATGAQRAIDEGDSLGDCPWDQEAVIDAVGKVVTLVPEYSALGTTNGQVFRGGDVDITYCEIYPEGVNSTAPDGIVDLRIDVHPGEADLQTYIDEEWGGDADNATTSKFEGGTARAWCPDPDQCIAAWQGDGLFVAVAVYGVATATTDDAVAALKKSLPIVVDGLVAFTA